MKEDENTNTETTEATVKEVYLAKALQWICYSADHYAHGNFSNLVMREAFREISDYAEQILKDES